MSTTLPARLGRLLLGLTLFGASVALMVRALPDPGRDVAAELMLDEIARLTAALASLRVPA